MVRDWFEITSELFINLAAGWFAVVFIEPQISGFTPQTFSILTIRFTAGIVTLALAKRFRDEAKRL